MLFVLSASLGRKSFFALKLSFFLSFFHQLAEDAINGIKGCIS
jgi:hypothetical protein